MANADRLNKSLASQQQTAERGTIIAGPGARSPLRDAERLARDYGGNPDDWVKKSSSKYVARNGTAFETHWVENLRTGQRVEQKTKLIR